MLSPKQEAEGWGKSQNLHLQGCPENMTRVETIASHTRGSEGVGLRFPDEGHIDVRFECGQNGTIKRSESQGGKHMRLETITGQVMRTVAGTVAIPGGYNALAPTVDQLRV